MAKKRTHSRDSPPTTPPSKRTKRSIKSAPSTPSTSKISNSTKQASTALARIPKPQDPPKPTFNQIFPFEIRLLIWKFSAPAPSTISQVPSQKPSRRFAYIRRVPNLLHLCSESRREYLDLSTPDTPDAQLTRKKRDHAVYTLYCHPPNGRTRGNPVFFSPEIDSFWGMRYEDPRLSWYQASNGGHFPWSGIRALDLAPVLRKLVIQDERRVACCSCKLQLLSDGFPSLEEITFVFENERWKSESKISEAGERDGELDWSALGEDLWVDHMREYRAKVGRVVEDLEADLFGYRVPIVRFRFRDQLIESEGLVLPDKVEESEEEEEEELEEEEEEEWGE